MKIKIPADEQKVINHLLMKGKFKTAYEIKQEDGRVLKAVKNLAKKKLIKKDSDGFYNFNYDLYPDFFEYMQSIYSGKNVIIKIAISDREELKKKSNEIKFSDKTLTDFYKNMKKAGVKLPK